MSQFLLAFVCLFFSSLLIIFSLSALFGDMGLSHVFLISVLVTVLGSVIVHLLLDKIAALFPRLIYGILKSGSGVRERSYADFERARDIKEARRFDEALNIIDDVLRKDPHFPDAIYLKAQILWHGFRNSADAKAHLRKVMKMTPKSEAVYRQAAGFYGEISGLENLKQGSLSGTKS